MNGLWQTGHLPLSAGVGLVIAEATKSPVLGLVAASASHYAVDGITVFPDPRLPRPDWINWLEKNFNIIALVDCLVGWGLITSIGFFSHQSWFFWLAALMGFWPDLDHVPAFKRAFVLWPLNWLALLHQKLHFLQSHNPFLVVGSWALGIAGSYLFLGAVLS